MMHHRKYRGLAITIWGMWVEGAQSNLYQWSVDNKPLASKRSRVDFTEAYNDATAAIDLWLDEGKA